MRFVQRSFLWLGIAALTYAGGTLAYSEVQQRYLVSVFENETANAPSMDLLQEGDLVGKLEIPRVGISVMVLQGTAAHTLAAGAGHVPGTPLPGAGGNSAIAAHRDTFFRGLKDIKPGDSILFSTRRHTYQYVVEFTETVDPQNTGVIESRAHPELTLITCYPFYFIGPAPKRFIVHAGLTDPQG